MHNYQEHVSVLQDQANARPSLFSRIAIKNTCQYCKTRPTPALVYFTCITIKNTWRYCKTRPTPALVYFMHNYQEHMSVLQDQANARPSLFYMHNYQEHMAVLQDQADARPSLFHA